MLSGRPSGSHKIEGIGIGFIPPLWKPDQVDEIDTVSTDDAKTMARRLAREEAIFAGSSSERRRGDSARAAPRAGGHRGDDHRGFRLRYLSTDVFSDAAPT